MNASSDTYSDTYQSREDAHFQKNLEQLIHGDHPSPHEFLGLQQHYNGQKVIRIWRPGADQVYFELFGEIVEAHKHDSRGLFDYIVPSHTSSLDYRIYHQSGVLAFDPYAFHPTVGDIDKYLFSKGVHYLIYNVLGGRLTTHEGAKGVKFSVWAPSAKRVSLVADFNHFDGRQYPMRCSDSGIWEIFIPGLTAKEKYKFEIKTQSNQIVVKADPYAFSSELRPATASVVEDVDKYSWADHEWISKRQIQKDDPKPLNIYEVHLGSWKWYDGKLPNYRQVAHDLSAYCKEMGFTHVELLPIAEHPLDESWGYQVSGYYAITSRFGTPEDFQYFVDHLHQNNIGVIVDWVPGHFPTDHFSLGRFDGTALYEHEDPRQGMHPHWQTHIFNFDRHEVSNFLIGNALFLFDKMHIDGLRVDAVASMLYLDYGRNEGEWIPNRYGGKENLGAIEFFKHLNSVVHEKFPGILMIAEESTSFTGVTHPVSQGGLGFNYKWNMGWMNDTLRYFSTDMIFRNYHQNDLTFGLLYAFSERFINVFSHDEVVHGKHSLISKMPGDWWQKFANLRLLYSYSICQPGKKLLFMGSEFGQWDEWYCKKPLDWFLLEFPTHQGMKELVKDINHFYLHFGCLWDRDFDHHTFEWVDLHDSQNSVISYLRKGPFGILLCIHNFTPMFHQDYNVQLGNLKRVKEVFNTDNEKYGGSGKVYMPTEITKYYDKSVGLKVSLAPLATMIFEVEFY